MCVSSFERDVLESLKETKQRVNEDKFGPNLLTWSFLAWPLTPLPGFVSSPSLISAPLSPELDPPSGLVNVP